MRSSACSTSVRLVVLPSRRAAASCASGANCGEVVGMLNKIQWRERGALPGGAREASRVRKWLSFYASRMLGVINSQQKRAQASALAIRLIAAAGRVP